MSHWPPDGTLKLGRDWKISTVQTFIIIITLSGLSVYVPSNVTGYVVQKAYLNLILLTIYGEQYRKGTYRPAGWQHKERFSSSALPAGFISFLGLYYLVVGIIFLYVWDWKEKPWTCSFFFVVQHYWGMLFVLSLHLCLRSITSEDK